MSLAGKVLNRIQRRLRVKPAMGAGITDHV